MEDLKFKTAAQVMNHSNTKGRDADFYTNHNKGYAMAINGYRISVQWGPGNYVDREVRYGNDHDAPMQHNIWGCDTAEVLIWDEAGRFAPNGSKGGSLFETAPWNDEAEEYDFDWLNAKFQGRTQRSGIWSLQFRVCCTDDWYTELAVVMSDPRPAIGQIYEGDIKKK
jgi:hypothetical protein